MEESDTLRTALKAAEPIIQEYVRQLKAYKAKLEKEIVKLELNNEEYKNRAAALKKELKESESSGGLIINMDLSAGDEETTK